MGILTSPFRGLLSIFEKIHDLAEEELYNEDAIKEELAENYKQLETGLLTNEEFDRREEVLVKQLEEIAERKSNAN